MTDHLVRLYLSRNGDYADMRERAAALLLQHGATEMQRVWDYCVDPDAMLWYASMLSYHGSAQRRRVAAAGLAATRAALYGPYAEHAAETAVRHYAAGARYDDKAYQDLNDVGNDEGRVLRDDRAAAACERTLCDLLNFAVADDAGASHLDDGNDSCSHAVEAARHAFALRAYAAAEANFRLQQANAIRAAMPTAPTLDRGPTFPPSTPVAARDRSPAAGDVARIVGDGGTLCVRGLLSSSADLYRALRGLLEHTPELAADEMSSEAAAAVAAGVATMRRAEQP